MTLFLSTGTQRNTSNYYNILCTNVALLLITQVANQAYLVVAGREVIVVMYACNPRAWEVEAGGFIF